MPASRLFVVFFVLIVVLALLVGATAERLRVQNTKSRPEQLH
jgi:hypothetical protein